MTADVPAAAKPRHPNTARALRGRWRLALLGVILVAELVAVGIVLADPKPPASATLDAMYRAPDPLPTRPPGTPARVWKLPAPDVHGTVYGVLYHSRTMTGADTVVSGYLAVPDGPLPAGGRVIVALGHGTVGSGDDCAPSRAPDSDATTINPFLAQGWAVASTDFAGIGGPGPSPYLVGESEARSMIDGVRAARSLLGRNASNRFLAWGISQGGHAALFTRQVVASWAPELTMLGAVAVAPVADVASFVDHPTIAAQAITLISVSGYSSAYPQLKADQVLTPRGMSQLGQTNLTCLAQLEGDTSHIPLAQLRRIEPGALADWRRELDLNSPGQVASPIPVLVVQGTSDPIVPLASSEALFVRLCSTTDAARLDVIRGASHGADVIGRGRAEYLKWMETRAAGQPTTSNCSG